MSKAAIRPEDILPDSESFTDINGVTVRKGSIAAFLKNIDIFENSGALEQEKFAALDMLKKLAPAVVAAGLHKHADFKNKAVQAILDIEAANL
jgi:hypothetical protein